MHNVRITLRLIFSPLNDCIWFRNYVFMFHLQSINMKFFQFQKVSKKLVKIKHFWIQILLMVQAIKSTEIEDWYLWKLKLEKPKKYITDIILG